MDRWRWNDMCVEGGEGGEVMVVVVVVSRGRDERKGREGERELD